MLPAQKRLCADDLPGLERDDGLIANQQFSPPEGSSKVLLQLFLLEFMGVHGGIEYRVIAPAPGFGASQSGVDVS